MMDEAARALADILICAFEGGYIAFFMFRFFNLRVKAVWLYVYYAAMVAALYMVNTFFSNGFCNFIMTLFVISGYTQIFRTTISQKIFTYASLIIIMCFSEMIGAAFAAENGIYQIYESTEYRININYYWEYNLISLLYISSAYIMIYFFSIWVRKREIIREDKGFKLQDICLCVVSALSFTILWITLVQYTNGRIGLGVSVFIMIAMIIIVMTFYLSYEYMIKADRTIMEKRLLEEEYMHKKTYYEQMERHQNEIRRIRHDLKNQLLGIMSDEGQGNCKKLKSVLNDIEESEIDFFTENVTLNMILNDKIKIMKSKGINVDFDIKVSRELTIDAGDLGILCGNLLDNAVEASEKCAEGVRSLSFHAYYYKNSLVIMCENSIAAPVLLLNTGKADKQNHGIGLKSIDEIVAKYNGKRETSSDGNSFRTEINIWLNAK